MMFGSCLNNKKIVFQPEAAPEKEDAPETGKITDSQSIAMPEWINAFFDNGIAEVESLAAWQNNYIFIGKNQGTSFNGLKQWAAEFSPMQDFPRLAAARIEKRLLDAASLYPDDEYGQFFELLVKSASDAQYGGAVKEDSFWIKRQFVVGSITGTESDDNNRVYEIYEFYVLISVDKTLLQDRIKQLMAEIKTDTPPTRAQRAAINKVQQNFFEGF